MSMHEKKSLDFNNSLFHIQYSAPKTSCESPIFNKKGPQFH